MLAMIFLLSITLNALADDLCSEVFYPNLFKFRQVKNVSKERSSKYSYEATVEELTKTNISFRQRFNNLGNSYQLRGPVKIYNDIPLSNSSSFRKMTDDEMINRYGTLSTTLKDAILTSYNTLNDPIYVERYLKELYTEAFDWMKKNSKADISKHLLNGILTERSIAVVLIRRFKARGDTRFTKLIKEDFETGHMIVSGKVKLPREIKVNDNAAFREAIKGPFIDASFSGFAGHGAYAHMLQRDMLFAPLSKLYRGSPQHFYDFLGQKSGVSFWIDLFDSGPGTFKSFSRPEDINIILKNKFFMN
jgi:hypothetical protein